MTASSAADRAELARLRRLARDRAETFVELGEALADVDRFMMTDADWDQWAERVWAEADERGAWFLLASRPDGDEFVLDLVRPSVLVSERAAVATKLRGLNLRRVRFYGRPS